MSDYSAIEEILKKRNFKIFRRIFMKRRNPQDFEPTWQPISNERIISYGTITNNFDKPSVWQVVYSNVSVVLNNFDGYFSDTDNLNSFFSGCSTRLDTMIKIEAGYLDEAGIEYPANPTVFVGYLLTAEENERQITLTFAPISEIMKRFMMTDADLVTGVPFENKEIMDRLVSQKDSLGNYNFGRYYDWHNWHYKVGRTSGIIIGSTYTMQDYKLLTVWEASLKLAESVGQSVYFDPQGRFHTGYFEPDYLYGDEDGYSATAQCILYNNFNLSKFSTSSDLRMLSEVGDTLTFSNSITSSSFAASKFSEGIVPSSGNYISRTPLTNFDPNKFTIEFWATCNFSCTSGLAGEQVNIFDWTSTAGDSKFNIGFGNGTSYGNYLNYYQHNSDLYYYTAQSYSNSITVNCLALTSTVTWQSGTTHFFAITKDSDGIAGTEELVKIYHAANSSAVECVATYTIPAGATFPMAHQLEGAAGWSHGGIFTIGKLSTVTSQIVIDNLKIYNYAKQTFTKDYINTATAYTAKKKHSIIGLSDNQHFVNVLPGCKINKNYSKIINDVTVKHDPGDTTTSYVYKSETWTKNDGSSTDLYGKKTLEIENSWLNTATATDLATRIYTTYKDLKREVEVGTFIYPWLIPTEQINFVYQTPLQINSEPFSDGFDDGFGDGGRTYNITGTTMQILKISTDLDKISTKLTLREV
jgi:hypothetical protein